MRADAFRMVNYDRFADKGHSKVNSCRWPTVQPASRKAHTDEGRLQGTHLLKQFSRREGNLMAVFAAEIMSD
jgi:hypothetical protein